MGPVRFWRAFQICCAAALTAFALVGLHDGAASGCGGRCACAGARRSRCVGLRRAGVTGSSRRLPVPLTLPIGSMPATGCASWSTAGGSHQLLRRRCRRLHHHAADRRGARPRPDAGRTRCGHHHKTAQWLHSRAICCAEVEAYRPFFILGEVAAPRPVSLRAQHDGRDAVAIAGGFSPRAQKGSVDLTRTDQGARCAPPCRLARCCARRHRRGWRALVLRLATPSGVLQGNQGCARGRCRRSPCHGSRARRSGSRAGRCRRRRSPPPAAWSAPSRHR